MAIRIAPLDDAIKKRLFQAVAQRGHAAGLEAASKILLNLAGQSMRVVGTNTIKELAAALQEKATATRRAADADIAAMEAETKL